ncbi:MAG: DUF167 domain-containing protein [Planctomycetota bacterium]
MTLPPWIVVRGEDLEIRIKAVPGARRDEIAGAVGDRIKVRVSAPPEGGRANEAILRLLSKALAVPGRSVELANGAASPRKSVVVRGAAGQAEIAARILAGTRDETEAV